MISEPTNNADDRYEFNMISVSSFVEYLTRCVSEAVYGLIMCLLVSVYLERIRKTQRSAA
jgi:hypothetical protein